MQIRYLGGKELINGYAIWEASSVIVLCFYSLGLMGKSLIGEECVGRYMKKIEVFFFYVGIIVKFLSAIISVVYVEFLWKCCNEGIVYCIQLILIICDLIISIYLCRVIFKIENSSEKKQKSVRNNKIVCTVEQKNELEEIYARACVMIIGNFAYNFILPYSNSKITSYVVLLINLIIILWFYKKIIQSENLIENYHEKYHIRAIGYLIVSNIVNIHICGKADKCIEDIYFMFVFDFFVGVCVYLQLLRVIEKTLVGMKEYLNKK